MTHFGHYNFIRQCKQLGQKLFVGVHNDEEITKNKSPPVFTLEERVELISACKWVDVVVPDAPYTTSIDVVKKFGCDHIVHGDDIVLNADGVDCYVEARKAGLFVTVPRTKAISTTNLIGRMLRLPARDLPEGLDMSGIERPSGDASSLHSYIPTTHRISQFANRKEPSPEDNVVYVDGTFDLLHPGHISFLRKAKALGTYLVVGVHPDPYPGEDREVPVMTLQERVLNVLAVKYVDDVIIGAPYVITKAMLDQIEPSIVVQGSVATRRTEVDAFRIPQERGIFKTIPSDFPDFTSKSVIKRVLQNYQLYAKRNATKESTAYEKVPQ